MLKKITALLIIATFFVILKDQTITYFDSKSFQKKVSQISFRKPNQVLKMEIEEKRNKLILRLNSSVEIKDIKITYPLMNNIEIVNKDIPDVFSINAYETKVFEIKFKKSKKPHLILKATGLAESFNEERITLGTVQFYYIDKSKINPKSKN